MDIDSGPAERPRPDARVSYAQNMEDILLDRLFGGRPGTFVDVGANHPYIDSNTYFFYLKGWRGVNVEPSPRGRALFAEHRPGDLNLDVAVADADGVLAFHEIDGAEGLSGLSTLSPEIAARHREQGFTVKEREVRVRTLASIVDEHQVAPPDFLSVDVEGCEAGVIRGAPLDRWRPKVLVIESTAPLSESPSHEEWEPLLLAQGYLFAAFNGVNRFYLREDLRHALPLFATPVNVLDGYVRQDVMLMQGRINAIERERVWEKGEVAREYAVFEAEREAWRWGMDQARHLQAVWRQECDSFAAERVKWAAALAYFEHSEAGFKADRQAWLSERAELDARLVESQGRLASIAARCEELHADRAAIEAERSSLAAERAELRASVVEGARQIAHAQQELRPYKVVDLLKVVPRSYGLARRLKRSLAPRRA